MGKNSKTRRRDDRDEIKPAVTGVGDDRDADESEQLKAIRIERKLAAAAILRQLLGTSHQELLGNEDGYDDFVSYGIDSEQLNDVSDTVASDWLLSGRRMPPDGSDSSGGEEGWSPDDDSNLHQTRSRSQDEHLPSRKLVLRQMVMNQLNVMQRQQQRQSASSSKASAVVGGGRTGEGRMVAGADQELDEAASEADSWLEMEERFAEIYEPIPFDVGMDSWRSMTKQQMLRTVNSRRLRSSMQHMSRSQILAQIRTIKVQRNGHASTSTNGHQANGSDKNEPAKINHKNPVYEDMSGSLAPKPLVAAEQQQKQRQQEHRHKSDRKAKTSKKVAHKQRADSHLYQNTAAYDGETLADIYEAKVEAHRQLLRLQQQQQQQQSSDNGLYVTRAMVHAAPYDSDGVDGSGGQNRKHFVSRSDIVSKWSGGAGVKPGVTTTSDEQPHRLGHLAVAVQKSRSQMMEELRRQSDYITTVYSVGGALGGPLIKTMGNGNSNGKEKKDCDAKSCTSSCPSDCDGGVCDDDNCSLCSCSSCGTFNGTEEESDQDICNGQEQQQQRHRTEVAEQNRSRLISTIDAAAPVPSLKDDTRRTKNKKKKEKNKKATTSASPIEGDEIDEWRKKSSKKRNESGASTPEPVPLNLVKQRRMEFERLRILDEQETRLKELVRRQQQQHHNDVSLDENQMQTWSTLARRARLLEERWNQAQQRGHGDADDEVDGSDEEEEQQSERLLGDTGSVSGGVNKRKQRTKLIQQLKNRMRQNMAAVSLDPRVRQRRHEKLKQLLNDALHAGTQTLSNINLGLIYVPPLIDDSTSNNSPPSSEKGPNQGKKEKAAKEKKQKKPKKESKLSSEKKGDEVLQENGDEEEDDEDVFGSIDTLIFEPKNSSLERPSSSAATVNEDDLTDVERKIAQQFDYLYDSQYGGAQSDMDTEQPRKPKSAVAAGEEDSNSKNVRQAAAAGVVAAAAAASSTQVNLPLLTANSFATKTPLLHQQQQAAVGTAMAIVAASAEAKKAATVTAAVATTTTISPRSYAAAAYYDVSASCKMAPGQIPPPPPPPLPNSNQAPAIASTPASNNPSTDSDSDSDTTSNISFGSVIYQGQKLLDLAQKQQQTQRETGLVSQQPAGEKEGRSQLTLRRQPPLHPPPPPPPPQSAPESRNGTVSINGSVCFDSEQYTNADTDASWDYYPDGDALSDGDQDDQGLTQSANRPDEGKPVGPTLTVGNLRKRPTTDQSSGNMLGQHVYGHDAEADETARLLESLRMAEDSHMSTSLRLIFPPDGSKHRLVPSFQLDIAPDTVNYQHLMANRAAAEPTTLIDEFGSPVTHFRSLPELSQVVNFASVNQSDAKTQAALVPPSVRTAFQPHIGIRKRDTMIRELKLKLKLRDRQQQQQQQKTRGNDSSGPADSILKKPKTALDKLESILSSFSSLAEMKADGHIYRTANELRLQQQQQQQQPLSLPEYSTTASRVAAESAVGNEITEYDIPAILSTGYPHHLLYHILANNNNQQQQQQLQSMESMSDEPTTIYDPSLPGDLADFESLVQIQNQRARHGGAEVAYSSNRNKEMNPYYHEGLYSISEPLTERQNVRSPTARRNRRRRKRGHGKSNRAGRTLSSEQQDDGGCDSGAESTWSDMENRIFAMNGIGGDFDLGPLPHPLFAAADQMLPPPPPPVPHHHQQQQPPHVINNRMAPYHGDEWLFWDQLHQWRRTMVDQQRWEEEKARRMLLWVHHSQDPIAALASLGQLAAVGNGVAGGYPTATSLPHLPHWWQVD